MTTTAIIRKSTNARFGYEYVTIDAEGRETIVALNKKTTDNYLHLPENPFNRKLIGIAFLEKQGDQWEVTPREAKTKTTTNATTKPKTLALEEYLEGDDKELFLALKAKALANMEKAKLLAEIAKLQAELEELNA